MNDVASIGYNPITQIGPEGMAYLMPRLIELALDMESVSVYEGEPYLWGFTLQIMPGAGWRKFALFEREHFCFVCKVLREIEKEHMNYIEENGFAAEFRQTIEAWCAQCA